MLRIITHSCDIETELQRIRARAHSIEIGNQEAFVKGILEQVLQEGDRALIGNPEAHSYFLSPSQLRVSGSDLDAAYQQVSQELLSAISTACEKIEAFHYQRLPKSWVQFEQDDIVIGKRYRPVSRAGLYVPGGNQIPLSLVLLQAIPAKVAKVPQIVMVTPAPEGKIHPSLLVAAQLAGVTEIYRVGGVQAIAALAYGTETIPKVEVITGLGDREIALAKKMVSDQVAIDSLAQASELLIIGDQEADSTTIATDLLAQAERTPFGAAIFLTIDLRLAHKVKEEVSRQLENHPQKLLTEKALAHYGLIGVVESLEKATQLANLFAPQHLELAVAEPWEILEQIDHAGTIFLGNSTPMIVGDYFGGSASVRATARYACALGVETFLKYSQLIQYSPIALKKMSNPLQILAQAEGLFSSIDSLRIRTEKKKMGDY